MIQLEYQGLFARDQIFGTVFLGVINDQLVVASGQDGSLWNADLQVGGGLDLSVASDQPWLGGEFLPSQIELVDGQFWAWSHLTGRVLVGASAPEVATLSTNAPLEISSVTSLASGDLVVGAHDQDQLFLISQSGSEFVLEDVIKDDAKTAFSDPSDLIEIEVDGAYFLITASYSEDGLTSLTTAESTFEVADSLGPKDGIWVDGITALSSVEVDGTIYVLAVSSEANALVSLRVNHMGVFFPADQIWDDTTTRFAGSTDLETFQWNGRSFIVVGGQDAGLSLFEILPDGSLFHLDTLAQSAAWDIGPITQIEAQVLGSEVQIFVTGSQGGGVAQVTVDLARVGQRLDGSDSDAQLLGGWTDDLIIGGSGDEMIYGRAGDDILIDGAGQDRLTGDDGADIFVFLADGEVDKITDFRMGEDRIHLGNWGRIYDYSALVIEQTSIGARISWGDEVLEVISANQRPIDVSEWGAEDFIF